MCVLKETWMKKNLKAWTEAQTEGELKSQWDWCMTSLNVKEWNPEMTSSNVISFIAKCFNVNSPK